MSEHDDREKIAYALNKPTKIDNIIELFYERFSDMSGGYPPVIGGKVPLNIRKIIKQVGFDNVYGTVTYVFDNWEVFRKCESLRYDCSPFPTAGLIFSSYFEMFYSFYVKEELPELLPRGDEKEET